MKKTPRNFIEENVRHVREIIHRRLVCCNRRSFLRWSKDAVFKVLWSDSTAGDMYWCFLFGKKEVALQTSSFLAIYPDLAREVDATELSAEVYKTELSISSDRFVASTSSWVEDESGTFAELSTLGGLLGQTSFLEN